MLQRLIEQHSCGGRIEWAVYPLFAAEPDCRGHGNFGITVAFAEEDRVPSIGRCSSRWRLTPAGQRYRHVQHPKARLSAGKRSRGSI
jgi:hypothetical protein